MDLNESILNLIMQTNDCNRKTAKKISERAILRGANLSDADMKEFDDCLPTDEEWDEIFAGVDNSDLE